MLNVSTKTLATHKGQYPLWVTSFIQLFLSGVNRTFTLGCTAWDPQTDQGSVCPISPDKAVKVRIEYVECCKS